MLTEYIKAAMRRAKYKMIEDPHPFFGEVPELPGVWANAKTLEECRDELEEVVEGWLMQSISRGHKIPILDRINLNPRRVRIGKSLEAS